MKASHKCPDKLSAQDCQLVITVFKQKIELILEGHLYQILQSFSARKCDFFKKLDLMKRQLRINTSFSAITYLCFISVSIFVVLRLIQTRFPVRTVDINLLRKTFELTYLVML